MSQIDPFFFSVLQHTQIEDKKKQRSTPMVMNI